MIRISPTGRLLALAGILLAASAQAAPPIFSLLPFKKVEADPNKTYTVTKDLGPWMIMAISLGGDEAEEQASKLVLELRRDHKLEAWMHEQEFNLDEDVIGLGVDSRGNPKRMKNLHGGAVREIAVLVGNFSSAEDPDAQKALEKIRYLKIKSLAGESLAQRSGYGIRDAYRLTSDKLRKGTPVRGPLARAFVTRNPMLPAQDVARQSLDPFVADLNRDIKYSLLENPGVYTVSVATYRGAAAFSESDFKNTVTKSFERSGDSQIDKAAKDATLVVNALRKEGVEAYVFHDRHESLVTVGSFQDLGTEAADGHIELAPEVAAVVKRFEATRSSLSGLDTNGQIPTGQVGLIPKMITATVDGKKVSVPLDVSPRPLLVPRKSIADVYRQ